MFQEKMPISMMSRAHFSNLATKHNVAEIRLPSLLNVSPPGRGARRKLNRCRLPLTLQGGADIFYDIT